MVKNNFVCDDDIRFFGAVNLSLKWNHYLFISSRACLLKISCILYRISLYLINNRKKHIENDDIYIAVVFF